jgi:hypothetical protein
VISAAEVFMLLVPPETGKQFNMTKCSKEGDRNKEQL